MNSSIVRYILGHVLKIEAALMVIPVIVGVIQGEGNICILDNNGIMCCMWDSYDN